MTSWSLSSAGRYDQHVGRSYLLKQFPWSLAAVMGGLLEPPPSPTPVVPDVAHGAPVMLLAAAASSAGRLGSQVHLLGPQQQFRCSQRQKPPTQSSPRPRFSTQQWVIVVTTWMKEQTPAHPINASSMFSNLNRMSYPIRFPFLIFLNLPFKSFRFPLSVTTELQEVMHMYSCCTAYCILF